MYATDGSSGDTILGLASAENTDIITNYREHLQDLTELNGDGNRERGHYGEDESIPSFLEDDGQPSTYEEYQDVFGGDDWDHGQHD